MSDFLRQQTKEDIHRYGHGGHEWGKMVATIWRAKPGAGEVDWSLADAMARMSKEGELRAYEQQYHASVEQLELH